MFTDIRATGFTLTQALHEHAERRLLLCLGWAGDEIKSANMRLSDINGPRGGLDKRCQIQISASGITDIVIENTEIDLYLAIDRACDRAQRTLVRKLSQLHELSHKSTYTNDIDESPSTEHAKY